MLVFFDKPHFIGESSKSSQERCIFSKEKQTNSINFNFFFLHQNKLHLLISFCGDFWEHPCISSALSPAKASEAACGGRTSLQPQPQPCRLWDPCVFPDNSAPTQTLVRYQDDSLKLCRINALCCFLFCCFAFFHQQQWGLNTCPTTYFCKS